MCSALRPPVPYKLLQCWQTKATLQGEHMLLASINHRTLGCLSKVIYCSLQCTFVAVVISAENTRHLFVGVQIDKVRYLGAHACAMLHSAALSRCRLVMPTNKVNMVSAHQHQILNMPSGLCRPGQALGPISTRSYWFCVNSPKC